MLLPRSLLRTHATAAAYVARKPSIASRAFHASAILRAIDMSKVDTTERLAELRKLMKERNVDIYSTKPRSSNAASSLTHTQWYRPKTATRAST
jgi:Xaa-Pro aminopeptidase